jgi:UDP-N-acetylmuramoyl-tripeptide--D-alanyl-D-alanine ligase
VDAARAVGGQAQGDWQCRGLSLDSRALAHGDLFVALKVERDGHAFVQQALAAGASAALVSDAGCAPKGAPLLIVEDTLLALELLGTAARRRNSVATRVAVTGSVGKTTVKEMTAKALSASGKTHASVKSYNNQWGVPLTLARMPQDVRFGVFEIGMNHGGEIARLSPQVRPHIAAITTVQPVHIEHFDDEAGIADAKAEIFLGLDAGATALIPSDNAFAARLAARARDRDGVHVVRFGQAKGSDSQLLGVSEPDRMGARSARADILGQKVAWQITEPGDHWVHNGLCALTLSALAHADLPAAAEALSRFGAIDGRGVTKAIALPTGGFFTLVDEAYNANPASMAEAITTLSSRAGLRRIAILGDMLELGTRAASFHAALAQNIEAARIDLVFCAGGLMQHLWDALPPSRQGAYAPSAAALAPLVKAAIAAGDVVMVKGSNGSKMTEIVRALSDLSAVSGEA